MKNLTQNLCPEASTSGGEPGGPGRKYTDQFTTSRAPDRPGREEITRYLLTQLLVRPRPLEALLSLADARWPGHPGVTVPFLEAAARGMWLRHGPDGVSLTWRGRIELRRLSAAIPGLAA